MPGGWITRRTLKNGSYAYLASWRDSANRKHSKQFKLRRDAQNHLDAMRTEVKTGVFIPAKTGRTTLDAWWDEWWVTQVQLRGSTEARDAASYIMPMSA